MAGKALKNPMALELAGEQVFLLSSNMPDQWCEYAQKKNGMWLAL